MQLFFENTIKSDIDAIEYKSSRKTMRPSGVPRGRGHKRENVEFP